MGSGCSCCSGCNGCVSAVGVGAGSVEDDDAGDMWSASSVDAIGSTGRRTATLLSFLRVLPALFTWLPKHTLQCNNQGLRTTLFNRRSANVSSEENSKLSSNSMLVSFFSTTRPQTTIPNRICFAPPPTDKQGSNAPLSFAEHFCPNTHKSPSTSRRKHLRTPCGH